MKRFFDIKRRVARFLLAVTAVMASGTLMQSCHMLDDGEGDCSVNYLVGFKFTNNILEANAFASQVKSVTLLVYNKNGELVTSKTESGSALESDNYTMAIDIEPGTYDLVAWAGLEGNTNFSLNGGTTPTRLTDATVTMARTLTADGATSSSRLQPVFHAINTNVSFPGGSAYGDIIVTTMDLTKNTNTLRVILTHYNGTEIDPNDFTFAIADNNGKMNYDNSLLADDQITYLPWTKRQLESVDDYESRATGRAEVSSINSMMAEIDMARLLTSHNPRLTIQAAGKDDAVLSLPITQLLLHAKGEAKSSMSDQEYLDRQDEYNIMFFLNDDNGWYMDGGIYINGWHMRYQSADM